MIYLFNWGICSSEHTKHTHTHTKTHIKSLKGKIYVNEVKTFKKYEIYMLGNWNFENYI